MYLLNYILNFRMNNQKIYLSYSHANKNIVRRVADRLKEVYPIWIDIDHLTAGAKIDEEIANAVKNSSFFICFISKTYCESHACNREFSFANNLRKKILPVMLEREATNGIELSIASLHRLHAYRPPNVFDPWSEDLYQNLLNNILDLTI